MVLVSNDNDDRSNTVTETATIDVYTGDCTTHHSEGDKKPNATLINITAVENNKDSNYNTKVNKDNIGIYSEVTKQHATNIATYIRS